MPYRHVQNAPRMYLICGFGAVLGFVGIAAGDELDVGRWAFLALAVLLVVTGLVIARLTVTVGEHAVTASFGWGWPSRRIELDEINTACAVRNSWWHGWGIRKVSHGWMYNNAGRDAIALTLRSGKAFRIGTDQPGELLAALERAQTA